MYDNLAVAWLLTGIFSITGVYSLIRAGRGGAATDRLSYGAHVLMSAAMVAMSWSWGMRIPATVEIVVFSLAALFYGYLLVAAPQAHAGPGGAHHSGPALIGYHVGMMTSMVWMAIAMGRAMGSRMAGMGEGGTAAMGGMEPAVTSPLNSGPGPAEMTGMTLPDWVRGVDLGWTVGFAAAAGWFAVRLIRRPAGTPLERIMDTIVSLLMAVGMAGSFALMR